MIQRFIIVLLVSLFPSLCARIVEVHQMRDLLSYVQDDTDLVVFDIDDTLGEIASDAGSDRWFVAKMDAATKQEGLHYDEALKGVIALYYAAQRKTDYKLVDQETPRILSELVTRNIAMCALTMRNTPLAQRTIEQLASIGIDFSATSPLKVTTTFPLADNAPYHLEGVVFCERHKKSEVLLSLFKQTKTPRHIVFIDDKQSYVRDVDTVLTAAGIPCTCLRFGYNDDKVKNFTLDHCPDPQRDTCIMETVSLDTILTYANKDTLVIFDLDNTLVCTPTSYASPSWFHSLIESYQRSGSPEAEARLKAINEWEAAQMDIDLSLVDQRSLTVLNTLKNNGVPTIALTSRGHRIAERTVQQLTQVGINVAHLSPWGPTTLLMESFIYHHGILFCDGGHKGKALKSLFKKFHYYPSRVVFVNDKKRQLTVIDHMLHEFGIDFVGVHYTKLSLEE